MVLARHRLPRAVTKPRSVVSHSFHQPFWPEKLRRDVDLVDGRVELDPGEAGSERTGVVREQRRPVRIVEAADPVRHPEVAQVHDGRDAHVAQRPERLVRERPVVASRPQVGRMQRRPVAQELDAQFAHQREVLTPARVVPALLHLVPRACFCRPAAG